jgi:hypothetical protein
MAIDPMWYAVAGYVAVALVVAAVLVKFLRR